ncbi:MAG: outer-membrane lipoprotein carrier protein LolA [Bacteroidetes bacterium]|nr:outer-membrane lipoprotein carrier protein LolA [Bacteroidota bacterium]MBU1680222.1 outer-membrane lipoprotein carrier protein LolA [Bacteroidota bacterium]MBU2505700.1 outer-membrane lipoprotein carrier protein LolA [Bacteroidota bacterium]
MIFLLALLMTASLFAQEKNAEDYFLEFRNKFEKIDGFSSDFIQTSDFVTTKLSGKFFYKKKSKFKIDLKFHKIISDGKTIWNYDSRFNRVIVNDQENDVSSFSIDKILYEYPSQCDLSVQSTTGNTTVIILKPKNGLLNFDSAFLTLVNSFISKIIITDFNGNKIEFILNNIQFISQPDKEFVFNPEKGTEIIDLR